MNKLFGYTLAVLLISGAIFLGRSCVQEQEKEIVKLSEYVEYLKEETVPIRFKILERNDSILKFVVKFFDATGNELRKQDFVLKGTELSFDFYIVEANGRQVAFPVKVFTDEMPPDEGIDLINLYNDNGFPAIFTQQDMPDELKRALKDLYGKIKAGKADEIQNQFGSGVHDIQELKTFMPDMVYKIVSHTKGGISVMPD